MVAAEDGEAGGDDEVEVPNSVGIVVDNRRRRRAIAVDGVTVGTPLARRLGRRRRRSKTTTTTTRGRTVAIEPPPSTPPPPTTTTIDLTRLRGLASEAADAYDRKHDNQPTEVARKVAVGSGGGLPSADTTIKK